MSKNNAGVVKRIISCVIALAGVALLSSCALLPPGPAVSGLQLEDSNRQADAEMKLITNDVATHNAAALKSLFSKTARAKAINLDSGISKFLAFFPSGYKNLGEPDGGPGETDESDFGKRTVELFGNYKIFANGKFYDFFFADFSVNQALDPNNVGLYALGVAPYNPKPGTNPTAASKAFFKWQSQFDIVNHKATGRPSIYAPEK